MGGIIDYGLTTQHHHPDEDTVVVTNEDLGVTATLVTTTNDNIVTTIPYPSEWDPDTETCVLLAVSGHLESTWNPQAENWDAYLTSLSMVDRAPPVTYRGAGADAADEFRKAQFTPLMYAGKAGGYAAAVAAGASFTTGMRGGSSNLESWRFIPKKPIPMFYPIYATVIGQVVTIVESTGVATAASFSVVDQVLFEYDYYIRDMTGPEKAVFTGTSGYQMRLAHLGS